MEDKNPGISPVSKLTCHWLGANLSVGLKACSLGCFWKEGAVGPTFGLLESMDLDIRDRFVAVSHTRLSLALAAM